MADIAAALSEAASRGLQSVQLRQTNSGAWDCTVLYTIEARRGYGHATLANPVAALAAALNDKHGGVLPAPEEDIFS